MSVYFLPLACPLLCFALHLAGCRILGPLGQKGVAIVVVLSSFAWFAAGVWDGFWPGLYFFLVSLFFGYSYFHLFNMAHTARRIELMIRTLEGKETNYQPRQMIEQRILRLCRLGTLEETGSRLKLKAGPLLVAALGLGQMRRLFWR